MISSAAVLCLSSVIYWEARGEPLQGQIAVAQVVLNRVKSKQYPNTVCKVVKQKKQFSWYPKGRMRNDKRKLATEILLGRHPNPVGNSLYFSSNGVNWGKPLAYKIGRHSFFR